MAITINPESIKWNCRPSDGVWYFNYNYHFTAYVVPTGDVIESFTASVDFNEKQFHAHRDIKVLEVAQRIAVEMLERAINPM